MERYTNNKCFFVNRSKLEGRIDPHQFHVERVTAISKIKLNNEIVKLKKAVKNVKSTTTKVENTDIYIGLENIESDTGKYIETNEKNSISSAGIFKKGNVLFPKLRPYLNKVHLADFDGICSTEFHIFEGTESFLNEFLVIYLRSNLIVNQTKHLMTGNTLPRLQTEDINNLPVPKISIEKQKDIIKIYNEKIKLKQQKEDEAKALLDSIDSYLLDELGIALPEQNNALENRIFTTNFSEITGGRIDPDYQRPFYKLLFNPSYKKFPIESLKNISIGIFQGIGRDLIDYSEFTLLKVKNIKIGNEIDFEEVEYVKNVPLNKILRNNDIISPFIGEAIRQIKFSIFKEQNSYFTVDNNTGIIRIKPEFNSFFVSEVLNSSVGKIQIFQLIGGGGVPFLGSNSVKKILIPLPSIEKQNEIAEKIIIIRNKAKQLQEEAKQILQEAQNQVEQMIIG